ncbi:MAG: CDP-glycerol glycerophosphotransferase family protein, partial [Wujia sp.]
MNKDGRIYNGIRWRIKRLLKQVRKPVSNLVKFFTFRIKYPTIYKSYARKGIKQNKVVFVEVRMPRISDSFELIYNDIKTNYDFDVKEHFLGMSLVPNREYRKRCVEMIKDIATAKYVFLSESTNVIPCLPLNRETMVTQLWHACGAFKKFGMSTADLIFGDNRKTLEKYPYHGNYTYVTVSSEEVVWAYEEAMSLQDKKGVVVPVGVSRTDIFYDEQAKTHAYEKLRKVFPYAEGKKVILFAPTFRGRVANAKSNDALDISLMEKTLGEDYVLLIKLHPFVKTRTEIPEGCEAFAMDVTDDMSIEELLFVSDICISDYSSLVFEYSLFEKPMIFFANDLDEYYDWRGFYYDYRSFVPGPIYTSTSEVAAYIA